MIRLAAAVGILTVLSCPFPAATADETIAADPQQHRLEAYRQALILDPDNQRLRYQFGASLLECDRPAQAAAEFRRIYPDMEASLDLNFNLGMALAATDDADGALLYFEQAEALGAPEKPGIYPLADAFLQLGLDFQERGLLDDARRLFARVLALDPRRADIYRLAGEMEVRAGDAGRALEEFSRYLQIYPDDEITREYVCTLLYEQALQYLEEQHPAEARAAFDQALAISPGSPLVLYQLGRLDYAEKELETAAEHLRGALPGADAELRPPLYALLRDCAHALLEQHKLREALAAVEPLVDRPAANAGDFGLAGNIHLALQEFEKARLCYRQALAIDPREPSSLQNRQVADDGAVDELLASGSTLLQTGQFRAALTAFSQAQAIDANEPRLAAPLLQIRRELERQAAGHFTAARLALDEKRPPLALQAARQGLALVPDDAAGQALADQALAAMGGDLAKRFEEAGNLLSQMRLAEARHIFQQVLALDPENARAQAGLETIAGKFRESTAAFVLQGDQALESGQLEAARIAFSEALRLQPDNPEGRDGLNRTEALTASLFAEEVQAARRDQSSGRLPEAREHFAAALGFRDDAGVRGELSGVDKALADRLDALLRNARDRRAEGDVNAARALYRRVLILYPEQEEARQEAAALERETAAGSGEKMKEVAGLLQAQEYAAALTICRQVLEIDPGNRQAQSELAESRFRLQDELLQLVAAGRAALAAGNIDEAENRFQQALAVDPWQAEAREELRRLEAIRHSEMENDHYFFLQGMQLYTLGRYHEAIAAWQRVLSPAPEKARASHYIAKCRQKLQQI